MNGMTEIKEIVCVLFLLSVSISLFSFKYRILKAFPPSDCLDAIFS